MATMGLLQYDFSRMHDQLDSVTSNLEHTHEQLSALGNLELLKSEMSELDQDIVAMRGLVGHFPDMARSVGALNGQMEGVSRTIVTLQGDTAGLPSASASIRQMGAELRGITERMNEMNRHVAGTSGNVADMAAGSARCNANSAISKPMSPTWTSGSSSSRNRRTDDSSIVELNSAGRADEFVPQRHGCPV